MGDWFKAYSNRHLFNGKTSKICLSPKRDACAELFKKVFHIHRKPFNSCMSLTGATGGDILQMLDMGLLNKDSTVYAIDRDKKHLKTFMNANKGLFKNIIGYPGELLKQDKEKFRGLEFFHFDALSLLSIEELEFVDELAAEYMSNDAFVLITTPVMARVLGRPKCKLYVGGDSNVKQNPFEFDYSGNTSWTNKIKSDLYKKAIVSGVGVVEEKLADTLSLVSSGVYKNNVENTRSYVISSLFVSKNHKQKNRTKQLQLQRKAIISQSKEISVKAVDQKIAV